jgi:hypothetical protein
MRLLAANDEEMIVRSGDELALAAMKKEHAILSRVADRAKAECDEYCGIGSEALAIHNEFAAIVNSRETGQHVIDALGKLQKRRARVDRVMKKDLLKLSDKQIAAEIERDNLMREIQMLECRRSVRGS